MLTLSKIESSEYTDLNKVISWFINLRWFAACGVFVALLSVFFKFQYNIPYRILYLLNASLILSNLGFSIYYYYIKNRNLSRRDIKIFLNVQVCCDYVILFFLIYFAGFLENYFLYFFVFHIMLTSFIFSPVVTFLYVILLLVIFIGVSFAEYYQLIPHFSLESEKSFQIYQESILFKTMGFCSTLLISAYLITSIKKRIEERGKRVEVELNHFKNLDKAKSNFILQVTHELRGPIAALKGFHEMILKGISGKIDEDAKALLLKANYRTENLLNIIDEMIDYAFMKSEEEIRYDKSEIRLKDTIDYNLDLFFNQAKQRGIQLISTCSKDLTTQANRDLLNIILSNLITNAVKYSQKGKTILVNAEDNEKDIHIMVKDEGMGIEPSEMDHIFEEFYRTRKAREKVKDGTGLGLPIVKRAVESLNGRITVYSEVDKGTSFHIYLPKNTGGTNGKQQNTDH